MILKAMETEGHTLNIPLFSKGQNYNFWKQRMMTFFDGCHIDMWGHSLKWQLYPYQQRMSRDSMIFVEHRIEDKNQNMRKSIVLGDPKKCGTLLL
ncbi:hypothetical protein CR513_00045, partial [Mucuna pruriens]